MHTPSEAGSGCQFTIDQFTIDQFTIDQFTVEWWALIGSRVSR
jgi:hypothetical protein